MGGACFPLHNSAVSELINHLNSPGCRGAAVLLGNTSCNNLFLQCVSTLDMCVNT